MKRSRVATRIADTAKIALVALAGLCASSTVALAQNPAPAQGSQKMQPAQNTPQQNGTSPMIKPPESASGSGGSSNPDNMPIKRPPKPTHDNMTHEPPASGATAK